MVPVCHTLGDGAMEPPLMRSTGPRVAESGLGLIADYPWSAPY
jgi:hypothetical protein